MASMARKESTNRNHALFNVANSTLGISLGLLVLSIAISYPLADLFSLGQQVASHVVIIVSASVLKVAYVARCIALYEQHKQVC
ncbi:hypothetical protein [Paraglaciecola polaris]|uniref:hypothetical protein n=1 Tax=Paraglaciecola polaris TaxID=222814 RepID=UPI00068FE0CC|nr:hypothetical protein [Paraglaciecola polaris]